VELRVLGPLEVRHEAEAVALPGSKPRELLALLSMRPNQSAHHWLGLLAATCAEWDRAADHLIEAERVADRLALPYWRAQAQIDLASTLTRRGRGDGARVRRLTTETVSIAEKNGFGRILAQADIVAP
jgi:hypothetical protein